MSSELLRAIHEQNRRNHGRGGRQPAQDNAPDGRGRAERGSTAPDRYSALLPELEGRLALRIRERIDLAVERFAGQLSNLAQHRSTEADPLARTQEVSYPEGPGTLDANALHELQASLTHALESGLERGLRTLGAAARSLGGDSSAEQRLHARLDSMEQALASPLILEHPAQQGASLAYAESTETLARRIQEATAGLLTPIEAAGQRLAQQLDDTRAAILEGIARRDASSTVQSPATPGGEGPLSEHLLEPLRQSQEQSQRLLNELRRDFSHLVVTLNSYLEENRDRGHELTTQMREMLADLPVGDLAQRVQQLSEVVRSAAPAPPAPGMDALREEIRRLGSRVEESLARDTGPPAPVATEVLAKVDRLAAHLERNAPAGSQATLEGHELTSLLGELRTSLEHQARQKDPAELIGQLRRDFGLLVRTLNQHLADLREQSTA